MKKVEGVSAMKKLTRIVSLFLVFAMAVLLFPMDAPVKALGDLIEETVPDGADVLRQGVYYYELAEMSGDYGEGLSPREGALLADHLVADLGLYTDNGGIPADRCVYISLDELAFVDAAENRECYIYSVAVGTPEGGLMGDHYEVVYRIAVDYGGEKNAFVYDDFSAGYLEDGDVMPEAPGGEVLREGVYYYELAEMSGDYGDGLSPWEGAVLADHLVSDLGLYSDIPADRCVYISLDELAFVDAAENRECYIYSVAVGTPEGGLMGDHYEVVYRIAVDYGGEKNAFVYDDFSG